MKEGTGQVTKKLLLKKNSFENKSLQVMLKEWSDKPTKGSKEMNEWDSLQTNKKILKQMLKKKKTRE